MESIDFVESFIKFILSRSNDELADLTIERTTYLLKISRSHIYHAFKSRLNITPGQYLIKVKILRSAVLLEQDRVISIKKISSDLGFSSAGYFSRVFKEHFGITPGRYRQYVKMQRFP